MDRRCIDGALLQQHTHPLIKITLVINLLTSKYIISHSQLVETKISSEIMNTLAGLNKKHRVHSWYGPPLQQCASRASSVHAAAPTQSKYHLIFLTPHARRDFSRFAPISTAYVGDTRILETFNIRLQWETDDAKRTSHKHGRTAHNNLSPENTRT